MAGATPLVELGLHHEQQHQELILTDIKHVLSVNPLPPVYRRGALTVATAARRRAGSSSPADLARSVMTAEASRSTTKVRGTRSGSAFRLASQPVTYGEYLEFIADGGYRRPEFWLSDGWAMRQQHAGTRRSTGE